MEWSVERQRRTRGRSETPTRRTVSGRPCFDRGCVAVPLRTATSASAAASAGPVRDQMPPPLPGGPIHLPPAQHHWPNAAGTSAKWPRPQPNSQPTPMDPVVLRGRAVTTQYPWTSAHFANVAVPKPAVGHRGGDQDRTAGRRSARHGRPARVRASPAPGGSAPGTALGSSGFWSTRLTGEAFGPMESDDRVSADLQGMAAAMWASSPPPPIWPGPASGHSRRRVSTVTHSMTVSPSGCRVRNGEGERRR